MRLMCVLGLVFMMSSLCAGQAEQPPGVEVPTQLQRGEVPDYFSLELSDVGCDPDGDCDDVGCWQRWRTWYKDQTGCNRGGAGVSWSNTEIEGPLDQEPKYDFSSVTMSERDQGMKTKIGGLGAGGAGWLNDKSLAPPWVEVEEFKFTVNEDGKKVVSDQYWKRLEKWAEAACRYLRDTYGVTMFMTGGNERDLIGRDTYRNLKLFNVPADVVADVTEGELSPALIKVFNDRGYHVVSGTISNTRTESKPVVQADGSQLETTKTTWDVNLRINNKDRGILAIREYDKDTKDYVAYFMQTDTYEDWHWYYMDPIKPIHAGMKKAHPDNKLIIGNCCYTSPAHVAALYQAGAKDNFEILAIHNYGKKGVHLDMKQILNAHYGMAERGDPDHGIILTEGWSCFPLPPEIDYDQANRTPEGHQYTDKDIEHYRQTVLDGWRNLMTPRKGEYDPRWVIGASYFVLNDHWGGRGWEKRAIAKYEKDGQMLEIPAPLFKPELGQIKGFKLDGYDIGTGDPMWIKPLLRPWGLIKIDGTPKGDTIFNFPPYLPKHDFQAEMDTVGEERVVRVGQEYPVTVTFTNQEEEPMTDLQMEMIGRTDEGRRVKYEVISAPENLDVLEPGQTLTWKYMATYPQDLVDTDTFDLRGYADAHYKWKGRPYHTDAWVPRVEVKTGERSGREE